MSLAALVVDQWTDGKRLHVIGTIAATNAYVTTGDTVAFGLQTVKSNSVPLFVIFQGNSKYLYSFVPGTTINNGKMKVIVPDTGLELAQANYPAGITGDAIKFYAIFRKFQ